MNPKLPIAIALIALGLGWQAASPASTSADPNVLHVLNRLSLGLRPGDVDAVKKSGIEAYIQQQLHPETIPQPPALTQELSELDTLRLSPLQLFTQTSPPNTRPGQPLTPEQRKAYRQKAGYVLDQAIQARLHQATESPRQLQEVMVDFWYNHFNVFSQKGADRLLVGVYEQQAIRPYVFGRFRDLLAATARHPAMLFYLDNWQNTSPDAPSNSKRKQGLNENYARELMELHTLGVDGGYTQQDVIALAKIFTGWTFRRSAQPGVDANGFYFDAKRHDYSDKVFLGRIIKGSGMAEAEQALDMLAKHPATARHLSFKLAQYFVSDQPPKPLVDKLAQKFLASNGNIRETLTTLFRSPEFQDSRIHRAKFKTPYQYVVSALRSTGTDLENFRPIQGVLQQLGMPLYGCLTPDGYKNTADVWLNPDAITRRINFATTLASGRLPMPLATPAAIATQTVLTAEKSVGKSAQPSPGMSSPAVMNRLTLAVKPVDPAQLSQTLGQSFSVKTQQAIAKSPANLQAALMLGSPEFMYR
jgi:uncharacterized protein (DUF1800 family)